jgi:hypothetical protein
MENGPSYDGSGLVNLLAEIELRLTDGSPSIGLDRPDLVPAADADTYILVLFDGLGVAQLDHPGAAVFRTSLAGTLSAPFPTTTSVSLATVATALTPAQHGQVAHLTWYPDLGEVVNTLKWVTVAGDNVPYDYPGLLPRPNLWERLRRAGREPITVQPGDFQGSPLTRTMYRGARFEGAWDADDLVDATVSLAAEPGRLIFTYVPFVDVAGHLTGQGSEEFAAAMKAATAIWVGLAASLPPGVVLLGTADHGLMEVGESDKLLVRDPRFDSLRFAGDTRGVHLWGGPLLMEELAEWTGGELIDPARFLGPDPSAKTLSRLGDRLLLAPPGKAVIPKGFDKRLRCYHGGLMPEEVTIPLLLV